MKKTLIWVVLVAIVVAALLFFTGTPKAESPKVSSDPKNISYTVNGQQYLLQNGRAERVVEGSSTKEVLTVFGEPVYGDLNGDGLSDAALILVSQPGGSGTFYYAVLAVAEGASFKSTNTILLGDRVAPQTVEVRDEQAIFNYADRAANEPMSTRVSIGKSLYVSYDKVSGEIAGTDKK